MNLTRLEKAEKLFYFPFYKKWTHKADEISNRRMLSKEFKQLQMILLF